MTVAVVRFDKSRTLHRISPYLHGHFIEHLGKGIYEGIWVGPDSGVPNEGGLRKDVLAALETLEIPVLRWPGGCFADQYHWRDGIGPRDQRPVRRNIHWRQDETNAFGTEEFMQLCRRLGVAPYLDLNVGSGTVQEAADWLEYCNGSPPSALAQLRAAGGSPRPHSVRFWGIGSETWGCGGHMTPEYYADLFAQYATFLRAADPDIHLVLCGSHCNLDWDARVVAHLGPRLRLADFLSVHCYSGKGMSDRDGSPGRLLRLWQDLVAKQRFLESARSLLAAHRTDDHEVGLILDEWGTWYDEARVENGLAMANTLADALFAAASLHLFHSLGENLFMANLAQTANVLQCLVHTTGPLAVKTPTYYAFALLHPHQGAQRVACEVQSPSLRLPNSEIPRLSVSLTRDNSHRIYVSLVNRSPSTSLSVRIEDSSGEPVRLREAQLLRAQSLAGENLPQRPHQVGPRPVEGQRARSPIRMPKASIVAGYIAL
jgi:alpha-N-arabinofuranosidase